jgi:hypothetical protein
MLPYEVEVVGDVREAIWAADGRSPGKSVVVQPAGGMESTRASGVLL